MNITGAIRDTVNPAGMPIDSTYMGVLPYRDGIYRWPVEEVHRFRAAAKLIFPITVTGAEPHIAQVADRENGDLTAAGAAQWARARNELHHDATVYVGLENVPELIDELGDEPCWLWVAWWNQTLVIPKLKLPKHVKLAAVQHTNFPAYDISTIVSPEWPAHPFTNLADW